MVRTSLQMKTFSKSIDAVKISNGESFMSPRKARLSLSRRETAQFDHVSAETPNLEYDMLVLNLFNGSTP